MLVGVFSFIAFDLDQFRKSLINESALVTAISAENSSASLYFNLPDEGKKSLSVLSKFPSILYCCLYDENGKVFAEYKKEAENSKYIIPPPMSIDREYFDDDALHTFQKINYKNRFIGAIYLRTSTEQLDAALRSYFFSVVLVVVILIVLSYSFANLLQSLVTKPIEKLSKISEQVVNDKDYSIRGVYNSNDEIGILYTSFNKMLEQIENNSVARDKIENELRDSKTKLSKITEISPVGIFRNDENGELVWGNQKALELTGQVFATALGHGWEANIHPKDREHFDRQWYSAVNSQKNFSGEYRFKHDDGKVVWVLIQSVPEYNHLNEFTGYVGTLTDVSKMKEMQNTLSESEEYNRMLFTLSPIGMITCTTEGIITDTNEAFLNMIDYDSSEIGAMSYWDLTDKLFLSEEQNQFANILDVGFYGPYKKQMIKKSKDKIHVVVHASLVKQSNNKIIIISIQNITEQVKLEKDKNELQMRLIEQQKLESIGILASGVAHEINNPIMGIINYAELLNKRVLDSSVKIFSEGIIHEGERIAKIVKTLLSFAHKANDDLVPTDVTEVIERSRALLKSAIKHDGITLTEDIDDELPKIICNPNNIEQVIINILTNSRAALNSKNGASNRGKEIIIRAKKVKVNNKTKVRISIRDNGIGIEEKNLSKIFTPFFTTKPRDEGTGLGLSISYGLLKNHKSELKVVSKVNKFTKFFFDLDSN